MYFKIHMRMPRYKVGFVFRMVIWSEFRMEQYRDDDHQESPLYWYQYLCTATGRQTATDLAQNHMISHESEVNLWYFFHLCTTYTKLEKIEKLDNLMLESPSEWLLHHQFFQVLDLRFPNASIWFFYCWCYNWNYLVLNCRAFFNNGRLFRKFGLFAFSYFDGEKELGLSSFRRITLFLDLIQEKLETRK